LCGSSAALEALSELPGFGGREESWSVIGRFRSVRGERSGAARGGAQNAGGSYDSLRIRLDVQANYCVKRCGGFSS